ncbi:uncharacterized protein [Typha latifolia]|uniref:uncharacterized protein n=1 Tax=Typha latifolia TaxID=4733 RepID=UPI003C2C96E5
MVIMAAAADKIRESPAKTISVTEAAELAAQPCASRRRLHNFSFPSVSWGTQRLLRCSKLAGEGSGGSPEKTKQAPEETALASMPWNLRTRRAAFKFPAEIERNRGGGPSSSGSPSPLSTGKSALAEWLRLRSEGSKGKERRKFSIPLSREEIEEDFLLIKGVKPPRRSKKRAKIVQRQLDPLFPGLWLSEITPDSYKIVE